MALGITSLKHIKKILFPVRDKWYDIGLELNVHPDTLDSIREKYPDSKDSLTEMLKVWLKTSKPLPTVEALKEALSEETIDEVELAEKGI